MKTRKFMIVTLGILFLASGFLSADVMAKKKKPPKPPKTSSSKGMVIFDMTGSPGDVAISTNLTFEADLSKSHTAIDDGYGLNTINIDDFHVLSRDRSRDPVELKLSIGEDTNNVKENLLGTEGQLKYFASGGGHLFDLNRLRQAADWMAASGNLSVDPGIKSGTYGTISFLQFLNNVDLARTMYGFVRVLVPLELGNCTSGSKCDRNSLGAFVNKKTLYGLCKTNQGLCSCAPDNGYKIKETGEKCDLVKKQKLSSGAQIRVKGSMLWDFVASADNPAAGLKAGDPIPFDLLPWAPRELYFKVEVPVMVNWEYDLDGDGAMDNMFNIAAVSRGYSEGILATPSVTWDMVAPTNIAEFKYYTGKTLTKELFATLDNPSKYHLMMPNGYTTGWAEAFDKLNITGAKWKSMSSVPFGLPDGHDASILDIDVVRNQNFEDIPSYLYSGGLIDMHDHVNISGLVYVPQGMELEAKDTGLPTRQYINGALVVRDTFFLEAKSRTVTVISAEPSTYSNAVINKPGGGGGDTVAPFVEATIPDGSAGDTGTTGGDPNDPLTVPDGGCFLGKGCTGGGTASSVGAAIWIEVRPQVKASAGG